MSPSKALTFHFFDTFHFFALFMAYFCLPWLQGTGSWRHGPHSLPLVLSQPPGVGSAQPSPYL